VVSVRGDPHLKGWHAQIAKRRGKHVAKTALSRKILVTAWAMMRDNNHYHDPDQTDNTSEALRRNKVRELERRSQRDKRAVSMWKAIQRLATDRKLRAELGLVRILPPGSSKPSR
jgi:squalene cyclase